MTAAEVQIAERLTRIETKLDALLTGDADHEQRIRKLEALDLERLKDNETKRSDEAATTRRLVYIAVLSAFLIPIFSQLLAHSLGSS